MPPLPTSSNGYESGGGVFVYCGYVFRDTILCTAISAGDCGSSPPVEFVEFHPSTMAFYRPPRLIHQPARVASSTSPRATISGERHVTQQLAQTPLRALISRDKLPAHPA